MEFDNLEMYEDGDDVIVKIGVPNIGENEIKVFIEDNMLHIEGKREITKEAKAEGFYAKE